MAKTQLNLTAVLPRSPDGLDCCVRRLETALSHVRGVRRVHVVAGDPSPHMAAVCLHYDPSIISLAAVRKSAMSAGAEITQKFGHAVLKLRAIGGEDLARSIERSLASVPGVASASVNLAGQVAFVEYNRNETSAERLNEVVAERGFAAREASQQKDALSESVGADKALNKGGLLRRNKELVLSLIAGGILAVAFFSSRYLHLPSSASIALYLTSYAFGAYDLVSHTLRALRKGRFSFDIDLLMLLAAIGAALLGEFSEGAFLLFLFSLAHALEHYALGRARDAIKALSALAPSKARIQRDGGEEEIPVEQVQVDDVVVVRPGERIPVDGKVKAGRSAVNQAPVTGESIPVEKEVGGEVFAGTVNGDGALEIETTKAVGDRTLDRVVQLVEQAQTQKAPTQDFTDRFEQVFVPIVLISDLALIVLPPLMGWWTWAVSFYRGMTLLVAASPCALALGTPAAVLSAIAQAARNGVLIKGGAHLENLGVVRAIAFDKTGTLTVGTPEVTDILPADGADVETLLGVAASVEQRSQHPLAQAIVRRAKEDGLALAEAGDLESLTARGVRSSVDGKVVEIGSLKLWDTDKRPVPSAIRDAVKNLQELGRSIVVVKRGDAFLGTLGISDQPRDNVRDVFDRLRAASVSRLVMLTGDNRGVGEGIGKELGVDEVKADLMPEDKVTAIRALLSEYESVAMVGDGVNDAPALANATVGVAMGGSGTAAALETADVALMADDLGKLPFAVTLSRKARLVIRQNLYLSLAVIGFLIFAATTGFLGIASAVFVHEGSTLVVIANALRLLNVPADSNLPPHN